MTPRWSIALLLCVTVMGFAQVPVPLSGEQILNNVEERFAGIDDYTVDLDVVVDLERLSVPPMHVRMYFKRPEKVHFESEGFALLPREGIALGFGRLRSRYSIESVRKDTLEGSPLIVLTLKPKNDKSKLNDVLLYVDPTRWTATRCVSPLPDGRTMTASFEYQDVDGHLLPATLSVMFASLPGDTTDTSNIDVIITPTRRPQLPRNGTVTIRYSKYRLNTGLSDEVFEQKDRKSEND